MVPFDDVCGRQVAGASGLLGDGAEPRPSTKVILEEIIKMALPNILTYVILLINELTNTVMLGHAGRPAALAAVGLANVMQNCFALSVGFGICGALDTLVSQAYGAGRHEVTCHCLQRCRIILTLQLIWMVPLLWFSGNWLHFIHQDPEVARDAGEYNRASVWGLFAVFQFEAGMKFLQNRNDPNPPAIIGAITSVLHVGWCSLFVLYWKMGNAGAGYANAVTWWSQFLLISIYLVRSSTRMGMSKRSLLWLEAAGWREWKEFGKQAIPSTVQLCSEWWFWEVCTLAVGYLGPTALAAHVSTMNWTVVSFMPAIGMQAATATLAGNALGANLPRKAMKTVLLCVWCNIAMWSVIALFTVLGRGVLSKVYTNDPEIEDVMQKLLCIFAVAGYFDSSQNVMGGALRGMGRTTVAVKTYIVAYWIVMLPCGCLLAFPLHLGIYGLWVSFVIGTVIAVLIFALTLRKVDYSLLAREASERVDAEESPGSAASKPDDGAQEVGASPAEPSVERGGA
mmetsp:Transcript_114058/g.362628  ORF Transcript_114058/g.362628 Transcript_114058/m.362628 type:complete len:511 (+) Transcript_114058:95-1627(+)